MYKVSYLYYIYITSLIKEKKERKRKYIKEKETRNEKGNKEQKEKHIRKHKST